MNDENKKDDTFEMIEVVKDAIVIYNDGDKKLFDAIHITDKGVFTGHTLKIGKTESCTVIGFLGRAKERTYISCGEQFIEGGGIPEYSIMAIKGGTRKAIYKKRA